MNDNIMSVAEYNKKYKKPERNDYEHQEQVDLFYWVALYESHYPELGLMFAIPNGGQRNVLVAMKMKAEGVKAGIPDIFLPVAKQGFHGLFIEMKYGKNKTSENQKLWIENLKEQHYRVEVCYGSREAQNVLIDYLDLPLHLGVEQ